MARPIVAPPKKFDETQLAGMTPPFNIRVEKIRGNAQMPIPMPENDDGSPGGTNWAIEDVRGVEQWLVTEWSGGGVYEITVTDSSPQPQKMQWRAVYDINQFPEKTPPTLADAAGPKAHPVAASVIPISTPFQPQQGRFMPPTAFPNGFPPGLPQQQAYYQQPQYGQPYALPPMPNAPMPGTQQWDAYQRELERRERENQNRERDAELRKEREAREKMERDAVTARHNAELEREKLANEARFASQNSALNELRAMMAQLASAIKDSSTAPKGPSPEIEQLKEQARQAEARADRERQEREAEKREAALAKMMADMQQATRDQMALMQRQIEMSQQNKPDQMLTLWQNSQREMMELSKELSRNSTAQMAALQQYMMNPRDMLAMAKESTSTVEQAIDRSNNFYGKMIETQQRMTENLLAMQPQSNGVVELVGNGMDRATALAEKYLTGKQLEAQLDQQGKVQVAEAQARAYAQTVIHQQQQAAQAQPQQPSQPQTQASGLGNPPPVQPAPPPRPAAGGKSAAGVTKRPKKEEAKPDTNKRLGKTDAEWFGLLMPQVVELRTNANKFIKSIEDKQLDKAGNPFGWSPEYTAGILIQAIQQVMQRNIPVSALIDLLFQDRYADFADVLLPDPIVTQPYRDEVVQLLVRAARVANGLDPDGETPDASVGEDDDEATDEADEEVDDTADDGDAEVTTSSDETAETDEPEGDKAQDGKPALAVVKSGAPNGAPIIKPLPTKPAAPAPRRA